MLYSRFLLQSLVLLFLSLFSFLIIDWNKIVNTTPKEIVERYKGTQCSKKRELGNKT